jgi:hypothetical protein
MFVEIRTHFWYCIRKRKLPCNFLTSLPVGAATFEEDPETRSAINQGMKFLLTLVSYSLRTWQIS